MNAPMIPITMSPIRPKPAPRTIFPANHPATRPTTNMTMMLSFDRYMVILPAPFFTRQRKLSDLTP